MSKVEKDERVNFTLKSSRHSLELLNFYKSLKFVKDLSSICFETLKSVSQIPGRAEFVDKRKVREHVKGEKEKEKEVKRLFLN